MAFAAKRAPDWLAAHECSLVEDRDLSSDLTAGPTRRWAFTWRPAWCGPPSLPSGTALSVQQLESWLFQLRI